MFRVEGGLNCCGFQRYDSAFGVRARGSGLVLRLGLRLGLGEAFPRAIVRVELPVRRRSKSIEQEKFLF